KQHAQQIAERKAQLDEHVALKKLEIEHVKAQHHIVAKQQQNNIDAAEQAKATAPDPTTEMLARMDAQHQQHMQQMNELMSHMTKHMTAPKRVVRDNRNKVVGVETVLQ